MTIKRLNFLKNGQIGRLKNPILVTNTILRLLEMGMTRGTMVKMIRKNFTENIVQIKIRGNNICINKKQASFFLVEC